MIVAQMVMPSQTDISMMFADEKKKMESALKSAVGAGAFYLRDQVKISANEGLPSWKPLSPVTPTMAAYPANPGAVSLKTQRAANRFLASTKIAKTSTAAKRAIKKDFKKTSIGFLGKLKTIFRYKKAADGLSAVVGVLPDQVGPKGVRIFNEFQEGGASGPDSAVFRTMQRYFYGVGFHKSTRPMYTPPRPLINPVFERQREAIMATMQIKFNAKMGGAK